jgi:hypothetical protein
MGYERDLDSFTKVSESNDLPAVGRALAWMNEYRNRTLAIPDREVVLGTPAAPGTVTLQGGDRCKVKGGGSTLKNGKLVLAGCWDTEVEVALLATGNIDGPAVEHRTAAGQPAGQNKGAHVRIEGPYERGIEFNDPGGIGNNDFSEWDGLVIYGTREENVRINNAMSVGHEFKRAFLSSGKVGIKSSGAFKWSGRMSGHSVSDFAQLTTNSVAGMNLIEYINSEGSARLYINYLPTAEGNGTVPSTTQVFGMPVIFKGGRFAMDNAVCDASENMDGTGFQYGVLPADGRVGVAMPINCAFVGPYTIEGLHLSHGLFNGHANGVRRIRFRVAGGGSAPDKGATVRGCTISTDNINLPILDRGKAENNHAYLYPTDTYAWFPDHAP